jgi:hypothetical protein
MRMAATICAGISKNMPGLSFAAAISSGNYWPNGKRAPVGNVLRTSEDNLRDTIKPRLVQMGADLSRIDAVTQQFDGKGKLRPFNRQPICRHLRKRPDLNAAVRRRANVFCVGFWRPHSATDARL